MTWLRKYIEMEREFCKSLPLRMCGFSKCLTSFQPVRRTQKFCCKAHNKASHNERTADRRSARRAALRSPVFDPDREARIVAHAARIEAAGLCGNEPCEFAPGLSDEERQDIVDRRKFQREYRRNHRDRINMQQKMYRARKEEAILRGMGGLPPNRTRRVTVENATYEQGRRQAVAADPE